MCAKGVAICQWLEWVPNKFIFLYGWCVIEFFSTFALWHFDSHSVTYTLAYQHIYYWNSFMAKVYCFKSLIWIFLNPFGAGDCWWNLDRFIAPHFCKLLRIYCIQSPKFRGILIAMPHASLRNLIFLVKIVARAERERWIEGHVYKLSIFFSEEKERWLFMSSGERKRF